MESCTIVANTASVTTAGALFFQGGVAWNTVISGNVAPTNANWSSIDASATNSVACCTTPGVGQACVTASPQFVDAAGADFRMMPASDAVNAGA